MNMEAIYNVICMIGGILLGLLIGPMLRGGGWDD